MHSSQPASQPVPAHLTKARHEHKLASSQPVAKNITKARHEGVPGECRGRRRPKRGTPTDTSWTQEQKKWLLKFSSHSHYISFGVPRFHLVAFGFTWSPLDSFGLTESHLHSLGFTWFIWFRGCLLTNLGCAYMCIRCIFSVHTSQRSSLDDSQQSGRALCVGTQWVTVVRSGGRCLDMPDGVMTYNCFCVRLHCCSPLSCKTGCCVLGRNGRPWYEAEAHVSTCQMASGYITALAYACPAVHHSHA